eukprot:30684-Pelagococcus_subviridis.AAC.1
MHPNGAWWIVNRASSASSFFASAIACDVRRTGCASREGEVNASSDERKKRRARQTRAKPPNRRTAVVAGERCSISMGDSPRLCYHRISPFATTTATTKKKNQKKPKKNQRDVVAHLGVHVERVQPPPIRQRGEYPPRVPASPERPVHVHPVPVRRDERVDRLSQHRRRVRPVRLVRAAHAVGSRLGRGDGEVPSAKPYPVRGDRGGSRGLGLERHEPGALALPRGGVYQQPDVVL